MRQVATGLLVYGLLFFWGACPLCAAETPTEAAPDFQEVFRLIRDHLAGRTDAELNRTAVQALVSALSPSVTLVRSNAEPVETAGGALVQNSSLFDGRVAYLRVGRVEAGLPEAVRQAYAGLATNPLSGVVIDLRFAAGDDYAAAAATADLFLRTEKPLLNWGKGLVRSKDKTNAINVPVAVLVNAETARAAEALAAVLRETGAGLVLGNRTAGQAMIAQEYPLKNGERLRIVTAPIQVGEGGALSGQGLRPDVTVEVNLQEERAYLADPFKDLGKTNLMSGAGPSSSVVAAATNRTRRPRLSEAELVRERKEGLAPNLEISARNEVEPEKPVVRDPALARALDVLKGLSVVRQSRS